MAGDDRPKKSWRERDAAKDRSSHRRDDAPRPGTRAAQRSSAAQQQYRSALEKLFDGGGAGAGAGWSKVLPEMPKDPTTEGRQDLLRAVRTAAGRTQVEKAVAALLARFALPDDPDVLAQVLVHGDDALVRQALEKLDALLPLRTPAGKAVLETRLRTLEEDPDRDSDVRTLAGQVRRKV